MGRQETMRSHVNRDTNRTGVGTSGDRQSGCSVYGRCSLLSKTRAVLPWLAMVENLRDRRTSLEGGIGYRVRECLNIYSVYLGRRKHQSKPGVRM